MDGSRHLGSIRPRRAERKPAQAFAALIFVCGLGNRAAFLFWAGPESILGRNQLKNFRFSFVFSIFWKKTRKLANGSKLSMIKELSYGKILDKISFMSMSFFCNFRNFVSNFLVKFDLTIKFNWKIESN
jgi:hypothetical protein